jgi:type II secretory pathway pseudopilin PulG
MYLVIGTVIVAILGALLLAVATYAIDKNADRRDHAQGR